MTKGIYTYYIISWSVIYVKEQSWYLIVANIPDFHFNQIMVLIKRIKPKNIHHKSTYLLLANIQFLILNQYE